MLINIDYLLLQVNLMVESLFSSLTIQSTKFTYFVAVILIFYLDIILDLQNTIKFKMSHGVDA